MQQRRPEMLTLYQAFIDARGFAEGSQIYERARNELRESANRALLRIAVRRTQANRLAASVPDNPFDVERRDILAGVRKMRKRMLESAAGPSARRSWFADSTDDDDDVRHHMPASVMSNFQEFRKKLPLSPDLRQLDPAPEREHSVRCVVDESSSMA